MRAMIDSVLSLSIGVCRIRVVRSVNFVCLFQIATKTTEFTHLVMWYHHGRYLKNLNHVGNHDQENPLDWVCSCQSEI